MGGIAGAWRLDGRNLEPETLESIGSRIAHRGPDGVFHWINGPVGMVCALSRVTPESAEEIQPLEHASGSVIVFDGRLDNRMDLLASLRSVPRDAPDSRVVLETYALHGDRTPDRLVGDFAFVLFDPVQSRLVLCRDFMGVRPLFYFRSKDLIVFGSEIKSIVAHPDVSTSPDEGELAAHVLGGKSRGQGRRTLFRGIERVPPSQIVLLGPDRSARRVYWDFDRRGRTRLASFGEYVEAFRHYFEQALARRLRSAHPVAIAVSGGLDSSSIICLAETLRRANPDRYPPIIGMSYSSDDGSPADENAFIRDIEAKYDLDVRRCPPRFGDLSRSVGQTAWVTEYPTADVFWSGMNDFYEIAAAGGARVVMTGYLGDQFLFDRSYLIDLFDRFRWWTVASHLREYDRWNLGAETTPFRREFVRQIVRDHLPVTLVPLARRIRALVAGPGGDSRWYSDAFRRLASRPASSPPLSRWQFTSAHAYSIYAQSRTKEITQVMEWVSNAASFHGLERVSPYADRDLISYLMSIPGEMLSPGGVPRAILREAMRDVIPASVRQRRWKGSFAQLEDGALRDDLEETRKAVLNGGASARLGFVDKPRLVRDLEAFDAEGGLDDGAIRTLSYMLGVEAWAETFFRSRPDGTGELTSVG